MEIEYGIYFEGLKKVWRNPDLAMGCKTLIWDLLQYAGKNGSSFPSQETLAKNHGISPRHVRNLLNKLKSAGLVTWNKKEFPGSNRYLFSEEIYCRTDEIERKHASAKLGSPILPQNGNTLPPKEISERNQLISSNQIKNLFEETTKRPLSGTELRRLHELCQRYDPEWVTEAIKIASVRAKGGFNCGYLEKILHDWKQNGKPQPKPKLVPCFKEGCDGGSILGDDKIARACDCKKDYVKRLEIWKKQYGSY